MVQHVALRFDVSPQVGAGHAVRARTLGASLEARGVPHVYVTHQDSVTAAEALGIPKRSIRGFNPRDGESSWVNDLDRVTHVITDFCHHRNFDCGEKIRSIQRTRPLIVTVIELMPPHHFVSAPDSSPQFVCTPYVNAEAIRDRPSCETWLSGERYATVPHAFRSERQAVQSSRRRNRDYILVCCGGSDQNQLSAMIVSKLFEHGPPAAEVRVVVGQLFDQRHVEELESFARRFPQGYALERDCGLDEMVELISGCRFLIGRVGLIRYEAACLGRTTLLVQETSDYEAYLRLFERDGFGKIYLLDQSEERQRLDSDIRRMSDSGLVERLGKFNQCAFDQIDGLGAERLLDALLN